MEKLILIDGTGLIYRGFYAIPPYLKNKAGVQTNAVFGFTSILLSILEQQSPNYMCIAFDLKGKTFRHEAYEEYKATRTKAPDELFAQIPLCKEVVDAFGIPKFELAGYEADDLLATICEKMRAKNELHSLVATGDFDLFQLISPNTSILYPTKGFRGADIMDREKMYAKYEIYPEQVCDYKALAGDSSDNIPGVRGIGPKGAKTLLSNHKTLEKIYENIENVTGATKQKLIDSKDIAFMSQKLCTLDREAPIEFDLPLCVVKEFDAEKVGRIFTNLSFISLLRRLELLYPQIKYVQKTSQAEENKQATLF